MSDLNNPLGLLEYQYSYKVIEELPDNKHRIKIICKGYRGLILLVNKSCEYVCCKDLTLTESLLKKFTKEVYQAAISKAIQSQGN